MSDGYVADAFEERKTWLYTLCAQNAKQSTLSKRKNALSVDTLSSKTKRSGFR